MASVRQEHGRQVRVWRGRRRAVQLQADRQDLHRRHRVVPQAILTPNLKAIWTAHHTRTSDETFADMCEMEHNPMLGRYVERIRRANGQQEITFTSGSRIMFGARENGFGRGLHSVDVAVFDEAQILTVRAMDNMIPS